MKVTKNEAGFILNGEEKIFYEIRRSRRARRMSIRLLYSGNIEVLVPFDTDINTIQTFLSDNSYWITTHLKNSKTSGSSDNNCTGEETGSVEYNSHIIPYKVKRSRRASRIIIKINRERNVVIVAPGHVLLADINKFASSKSAWIFKHTLGSKKKLAPVRTFCDGELWPWYGGSVKLEVKPGENPGVEIIDDIMKIIIPTNLSDNFREDYIREMLMYFFSASLYRFSKKYFELYSVLLNVNVPNIKIHMQNTKWGSCTKVSIILNLKLCMAPPKIIEYVVAHELCHIIHRDHSENFWNTLGKVLPDYKERDQYLKDNGFLWNI